MERCATCIIPSTFPGITFENGTCGFCRSHEVALHGERTVLGEEALRQLLSPNQRGSYDCAVPISGGKDSSYVLYYVVRTLGLRPLAMFMDSGFIDDLARRNVERECEGLGVDLVVGRASEFRGRLVREALETSRHLGRFVRTCGNCENNIRSFVINECQKHRIPFIIWGSTDFEDNAEFFLSEGGVTFRQTFGSLDNMYRRASNALRTLFAGNRGLTRTIRGAVHGIRCLYYGVRDNIAAGAPEGLKVLNPFLEVSYEGRGTRSLSLFDYVDYDPYHMIETLKRVVGWEAPVDKESRMDCRIHCFGNLQHLRDTGITADGFTMAHLVRTGRMTRDEALRREGVLARGTTNECREVLEELGIDVGDLLENGAAEVPITTT